MVKRKTGSQVAESVLQQTEALIQENFPSDPHPGDMEQTFKGSAGPCPHHQQRSDSITYQED